ncbi:MAG: DEAD/DEAH box helicase [Chloroflexota bacterium]
MQCLHGIWLPDEPGQFVQGGAFYLWIETDDAARPPAGGVHPRQLNAEALAEFLRGPLGLPAQGAASLARTAQEISLLLPSAAGMPLPSQELLPYVEAELPDSAEPAWWQVCCLPIHLIIPTLNNLHFLALQAAGGFQLGADLLFWHQFAQTLREIMVRDRYIPAMRLHAVEGARGKRGKPPATRQEILPGWEVVSDLYDAAIPRFASAMPAACRAAAHKPGPPELFAADPLLRHFAEHLLYQIAAGTPLPLGFEKKVVGTFLHDCMFPGRAAFVPDSYVLTLDDYRQWALWRSRLATAETGVGFTLCFRLEEADPRNADQWRLHFLVASRRDPSLQMSLAEYWRFPVAVRGEAGRRFDADFERGLLLALGYAARVYPKIREGMAGAQPVGLNLDLDEAFAFLKESAWVLEDAGYRVLVPAWWTPEGRRRARIRLKTAAPTAKGSAAPTAGRLGAEALISYQYQLAIDGRPLSELEWEELVNAKTPLVHFRGQWMELDREKMRQMLDFWQAREQESPEMTLLEVLRTAGEAGDDLEWDHDEALADMLARLGDKSAFGPVPDPPGLRGSLRDYQKRGVAWLAYLEQLGLGPCLADDMGLGKTLQVIACLLADASAADRPQPTLIIAPTSVLGNWRKEIERFAPSLRVLVHQGSGRVKEVQAFAAWVQNTDVVLTSFALARLDEKLLRARSWRRLVVDEAQNIKNPAAAQTKAIVKLPARRRLALTGTPVENRLRDLWSIFNFLNPGYLGKEAQFRKNFELPIQKNNDVARQETLKKLVEPFILRRLKTDKRIIDDLPDKVEQKMFCNLTPEQASLYEVVVTDVAAQLDEAEGIQRKGLILSTLLKLKQICNHPAQFLHDGSAFTSERSLKLSRLAEMAEEALESGESMLIFTQFTEIGGALDRYLTHTLRRPTYYLHGGTSAARRDRLVAEFQDPAGAPAAFILSLRAGGVGLNLTRASHVFHFDRWWNPSVEDQATDRAFRIGQTKNVFVHKFVTIGTVEEKIDALIEDKKRLSSAIVGNDEAWLTELDNEAFKELIALRRGAVVGEDDGKTEPHLVGSALHRGPGTIYRPRSSGPRACLRRPAPHPLPQYGQGRGQGHRAREHQSLFWCGQGAALHHDHRPGPDRRQELAESDSGDRRPCRPDYLAADERDARHHRRGIHRSWPAPAAL